MFAAELLHTGRTYLFATLDDKLHIAAQKPLMKSIFKGFELEKRLTFIVVGPAGIKNSVLDNRLKRLGLPEREGLYRHHIVVAVNEHRRPGRVDNLLGKNDGSRRRGHHLGPIDTGSQQQLPPAGSTGLHIGPAGRVGTDGWNTNERKEFFEESGTMGLDVRVDVHICKV